MARKSRTATRSKPDLATIRLGELGNVLLRTAGTRLPLNDRQMVALVHYTGIDKLTIAKAWCFDKSLVSPDQAIRLMQCLGALGLIPEEILSRDAFEALKLQFSDQEIVELSWTIALINGWNRMAIGMRAPVLEKPIE